VDEERVPVACLQPIHSPIDLTLLFSFYVVSLRTTHTTEANDTSSRSHAICQIFFRDVHTGKLKGKLSLVDLAGSERGTDTKSHNTQRRAESADINTSLLSLKECIRALGQQNNQRGSSNSNKQHAPQQTTHVPYRGSKLTLILKDCFTSPHATTTMIATVSPGASAADHSLNTLRYADRIKEQRVRTVLNFIMYYVHMDCSVRWVL
jgi:kinesin family protein 2/24